MYEKCIPSRQTISFQKYFDLKISGNNSKQWNCMHEDVKSSLILGSWESYVLAFDIQNVEMTIPLLHSCLDFYWYKYLVY